VAVVPGAEAGSLRLRQGERYRFVAQVGFGEGVLGIETSEEAAVRWYGDPEGWRRGEPRILSREQLHPTIELDPNNRHLVERIGKHMTQIQANLSVPIVLRGETVAEINLDSLSDPAAFDADSVHIARDYALQITALLVARRDREAAGHTDRVAAMATQLGQALKLDPTAIRDLRWGPTSTTSASSPSPTPSCSSPAASAPTSSP